MVLPWVRLHAVKDYVDLPLLLAETPGIPHTINVVPSLLAQLDAYANGAIDDVQACCQRDASQLTPAQVEHLATYVMALSDTTLHHNLPRLQQLMHAAATYGAASWTVDDVRDVQVLYTLAWTGPLHQHLEPFASLRQKGAGFSPEDMQRLHQAHLEVMARVVPTMSEQQRQGTIELSVTPFHHPILPLLCDSDVARQSVPDAMLPSPPFSAVDDASWHVRAALDDAQTRFGQRPTGMWPAEGAISMQSLEVMVREGIAWTASDDAVLRHSLGVQWQATSAMFPRRVVTPSGPIAVLFRDHELSDAIGFTYASWQPERAATDFLHRLALRRAMIVEAHGEAALDHAVVPIMLDGENCWEFYPDNGAPFLRALLHALDTSTMVHAVPCSQAAAASHLHAQADVPSIVAGSWIDGTFDVWIGSAEKNLAWSVLRDARSALDHATANADTPAIREARENLMAAEGSDWFWWYDYRHQAPHKSTFDELFRSRIRAAYAALALPSPDVLASPLYDAVAKQHDLPERIAVAFPGSAMHQSDVIAADVRLEQSGDWQRVVVGLRRRPTQQESLTLRVWSRDGMERRCHVHADGVLWHSPLHDEGAHYLTDLDVAMYLHAGALWNVQIDEERGSVRSFTTVLRQRSDASSSATTRITSQL